MDKDNSKEGKKEPGEFTQLFSAFLPPEPQESKPEEKPKPEPPAQYQPQRPARTIRIPLVENPKDLGEFTRVFSALQQTPPAEHAPQPTAPPPAVSMPAPMNTPAAPAGGSGDFTRVFGAPPLPAVDLPPQRPVEQPASGLTKAGTFRAFPAQIPDSPSVQNVPASAAPAASEAEFTRLFNSPLPASEGKVDWAAIENRPAPLPGPKAAGNFTQMFGRPDIGLSANTESAPGAPRSAKPEAPMSSFTSVFSPPKMEVTEPKMEAQAAVAAPAPKAAPADPKQAVAAPKTQGPPILLLAIVLVVIVIIAAAALYFFVIRK